MTERSTRTPRASAKAAKTGTRALARRNDKSASSTRRQLPPEERHRLIAERAYGIAQHRGFDGDRCLDDWLQAEDEIDRQLHS